MYHNIVLPYVLTGSRVKFHCSLQSPDEVGRGRRPHFFLVKVYIIKVSNTLVQF